MVTSLKQKLALSLSFLLIAFSLVSTSSVLAASKTSSSTKSSSSSSSNTTTTLPTTLSTGVTQSYNAASGVKTGMLVELAPKSSITVIPLSQKDIKNVLGVVIPTNNAAVVLTPSNASASQVLVNNSGAIQTLVSNQNGPIKSGDYLSISSLNGVAMEASQTQSTVVGRAEGNFDGKTAVSSVTQIKNSLGKTVTVTLSSIPMEIDVTHNPTFKKATKSDYVPGFIGKIVFQVTSKNVSAARVYIAMVIIFGLTILSSNMIFGGLKGGMIAVGRQPLSKKSIIFSLAQTVAVAMAIFGGGIAAIYMFLKV
jgi:hypothetical protein